MGIIQKMYMDVVKMRNMRHELAVGMKNKTQLTLDESIGIL